MCISVGWLFFFFLFLFFFFCFYFFLQKKWSPLAMRFISFLLWVSPWTVEGQGISISQTIRGDYTPLHTHALASHTRNTRHMFQAHTHTLGRHDAVSRTHSNWGRLQRQKGKETNSSLILFHSTNILTLKMWHTHTHTHHRTVKYTSH